MSSLGLPEHEIIKQFREGSIPDDETRLKYYQGTIAERGLRLRLMELHRSGRLVFEEPREIRAFDGLLVGHTDGAVDGVVIEYKTVPTAEILQEVISRHKLPWRVYTQIQAYMLWGPYPSGMVIYECRSGGRPWIHEVARDSRVQQTLHDKARQLVDTLFGRVA